MERPSHYSYLELLYGSNTFYTVEHSISVSICLSKRSRRLISAATQHNAVRRVEEVAGELGLLETFQQDFDMLIC